MAAHLAGALAANTMLPVIGIPVKGGALDGLDALLATVQMPSGIPVATVAINGAQERRRAGRADAGPLGRRRARRAVCAERPGGHGQDAIAAKDAAHQAEAAAQAILPNIVLIYQTRRKGNTIMEKLEQLYEGKAKKVLRHRRPGPCASWITRTTPPPSTALKKGTIRGKGVDQQPA